ncbi:hypothetical protein HQN60_06210 [Deefgea piscis]|uniref:Uncharacterized protein n=1 Tax=Deefgea piscis TaxID=2739061 RepID=A0A6M8SUB2_9NEIS|nr:hypothetical protein [Deefgea piscis]QKJ66329.1 hypothetical protein HQN60_06210 [Deefgea piscis]
MPRAIAMPTLKVPYVTRVHPLSARTPAADFQARQTEIAAAKQRSTPNRVLAAQRNELQIKPISTFPHLSSMLIQQMLPSRGVSQARMMAYQAVADDESTEVGQLLDLLA